MTSSTRSTARPNWDQTWIAVAKTIARRSLCSRDQVGAVIVSKSNRLLETGYNGPPAGFQTDNQPCTSWCVRATPAALQVAPRALDKNYADCPALHAEANALLRGDRAAREGGTIYVTSGVCFGCAKLIANSGLAMVVAVDPTLRIERHKHRNTEKSYAFLEQCGITVITDVSN